MADETSSSLPELDIRPMALSYPENVVELLRTPSPRNSTEISAASLSLEQQKQSTYELRRDHEESRLPHADEFIKSPQDVTFRSTADGIQINVLTTNEGNNTQSIAFNRLSQQPHNIDTLLELQQPRQHLAQPILPSLSIPPSPSISQRSLTPPPFSGTGEVQSPKLNMLEPISASFDALPGYSKQFERRRHSSVSVAFSPTNESEGLSAPIQFPEQRRFSLVDSGPIFENDSARTTISDAGQDIFTPPSRRFIDEGYSSSRSSSRSSSQQRTGRFSTFAEMGIQSFAMEKGEKTVETLNKGKKKRRDGRLKSRKNKDITTEMTDVVTNSPVQDTYETNELHPSMTDAKAESSGRQVLRDDGKVNNGKEKNCIIM